LRQGRHKYIAAPEAELYEIAADPGETANRLLDARPVTRALDRRLQALAADLEARAATPSDAVIDPEALEQLRALGYVAGTGSAGLHEVRDRPDPKAKIGLHRRIMAAQSALSQGDDSFGERLLRDVLQEDPRVVDAHQILATVSQRRGDFETAAERFRAALELEPEHRGALFGLASTYRALGREEEARLGFEHLLTLSPGDSKAVLALAEIHVQAGRLEDAFAVLTPAVENAAAPAVLHNQHGEALALLSRPTEAEAAFRRAIAANDRLAQPRFNLGVLAEEAGRPQEAEAFYRDALERAPHHHRSLFNLGRLAGQRGEFRQQRRLYEAALEAEPGFVRGYFLLGKLLMDAGELDRAEVLTREGLARDPERQDGPLGLLLLADILNRTGRPAEARKALLEGQRLTAR
jgi:Tfp pilus assembly protein PilF